MMISKTKATTLLAIATLSIPLILLAQDTRDGELANYDRELNDTYKAIMGKLPPDRQQHLRLAQRAWIQMRDADCKWAFTDIRDCLIDRTSNRTEELKQTYFWSVSREYESVE